jgi:hypothetical protein
MQGGLVCWSLFDNFVEVLCIMAFVFKAGMMDSVEEPDVMLNDGD